MALDGGSPGRLSTLRNANVACTVGYLYPCRMSILRNSPLACHYIF